MNRLYITNATDVGNLLVRMTFSDNTSQVINVGDFIRQYPHPQYNKYLDERKFRQFKIEDENIVWGKNLDLIFPIEQLYRGHIE